MRSAMLILAAVLTAGVVTAATPEWIWSAKGERGKEKIDLTKTVQLSAKPKSAVVSATCDNAFQLFVNGKEVASGSNWNTASRVDVAKHFKVGDNVILAKARNAGGIAGFVFALKADVGGKSVEVVSDGSWTWSTPGQKEGKPVAVIGKMGVGPWGNVFAKKAAVAKEGGEAGAGTDANHINVPDGFKVEKLYDVPKAQYGSWVGMTADPQNRLIVTDQYGGIYRLNVPAVGKTGEVKVEPIPFSPGGAHGVTYAFDSLYVAVNEHRGSNGLYRMRDTNGDGNFDETKLLKAITCGGEHGFHSIVPGPEGNSLYLVLGNASAIPEDVTASRGSRAWDEDHLLPRLWDARGHAKGRLAPGGYVMKTDPEGKNYEVIATGFRNEYDAAFDPNGELFAFDADMEWDIGSAWYRPTRVNHTVSGAEFGWRSGAGKWPAYYADSLPAVVDIGLGSPTGVAFGTGSKFPAKYQRALFINDWTYGTMYAVHLTPDGATFKGEAEDFINAKPLPLTDVIINPHDGAMYFMTGGRRGQSALYRVTYVGDASTAPAAYPASTAEAKLRKQLERLHLAGVGAEAIDQAWPHLDHADRFVRWAARVAVEKQPVADWAEKALAETRPRATVETIIALARHGDKTLQPKLIDSLVKLDPDTEASSLLPLLRAYQLCFTRMGTPDGVTASKVIKELNGLYPHANNAVNVELAQVLLYLNAPGAVGRTVAMLMTAGDEHQELLSSEILERNDRYKRAAHEVKGSSPVRQQMILAYHLRSIKNGWTPATRKTYFSWFQRASQWKGGNSLAGYIKNIRAEALETIVTNAKERETLAKIFEPKAGKAREIMAPKGPGRNWTVKDAVAAVEGKLTGGRDFKSGENLFHATACATCHRFAGEGAGIGPDLTGAGNRYTLADLMMNIIDPSKVISDQYGDEIITRKDGSVIVGRLGAEEDSKLYVMTNPFDPETMVEVPTAEVASREPSPVSSMPPGLVNALSAGELADLAAYLMSGGDPEAKYFAGGAKHLFDGKSLDGWKGDSQFWSVENGVIVGSSMVNRPKANTFLIWEGGEVADFTLTLETKLEGQNNSGVQYRSKVTDPANFRVAGYQADMHPNPPFVGMLYGEGLGRGIIAKRGEKVVVDAASGKPKVVGKTPPPVEMDLAQWHTYEITAKGNHLVHKVNGVVTTEITDNHKDQRSPGSSRCRYMPASQ